MPILTISESDERARIDHARHWLDSQIPELSSKRLLSAGQKATGIVLLIGIVIGFVVGPLPTGIALVAVLTACYVVILVNRVSMTVGSLQHPSLVEVDDEEALSIPADELPIYTVLVPLYKEATVVPQLVASLSALDYPVDRLDIKLIVEKDDGETMAALAGQDTAAFDTVIVPPGEPRTKPRALNYALTFARGDLVTIFDAEDRPDVLQLRKAAVAFRRLPPTVGCLQAQLQYWNSQQNLITRLFAVEYLQWFRLLLPGLASGGAPVPLGGTSNHMRRQTLEAIGGWDPYNVTEDADLGIRLHRGGFRCAILDSPTWEEANSDYVNWNNQRSRWYKGYLQTWLVHMRHPRILFRQLGWRGWLEFNLFVGGTPVFSLMNVIFWALTIAWFSAHLGLVRALFPTAVYYPALFCFALGNAVMAYLYVISARLSNQPSLIWSSILVPLYWLMMGVAAVKALWQLAVSRSFWEKTVHGLIGEPQRAKSATASGDDRRLAVADFTGASVPALAARLQSAEHSTEGRRWRHSLLAQILRMLSLGLLVFTVYVFLLGGIIFGSTTGAAVAGSVLSSHSPPGAVIGTLLAPRADLRLTVVEGEGSQVSGGVVGLVPGSALPGAAGDTIIVGHRLAFGAPFGRLNRLHVGDGVTIEVGRSGIRYRVTAEAQVDESRLVIAPPSGSELTLVTAGSAWLHGSLFVVRARLVSETGIGVTGSDESRAPGLIASGISAGWLASAVVWGAVALVAALLGVRMRLRWGLLGTLLVFSPIVVVALSEACLAGGHALPATL